MGAMYVHGKIISKMAPLKSCRIKFNEKIKEDDEKFALIIIGI